MKSLLILSLAIFATSAEELFCTPGTLFKMDCNTCTCSPNGKAAACTDMACPLNHKSKSTDNLKTIKNASNQVCAPLSKFNDYCNMCFCAEDGSFYSCTKMACDKDIWNKDGTLKIITEPRLVTKSNRQVCKPQSQFKDYCNSCACSNDGLSYACTRMMCNKDIWNQDGSLKVVSKFQRTSSGPKQVCKPRTQFKDYCNSCGCADDGLSFACTRMYCDPSIWNQDGSLKVQDKARKQKVCDPGRKFNNYCNTCFCDEDGLTYSCTRMMCDKDIWNKDGSLKYIPKAHGIVKAAKVCEANRIYSPDDCNKCICNERGTDAACTIMLCPRTNEQRMEEETVQWGPIYNQGDSCTPGKTFYSECNQCVCTESGNNAYCTFMACPTKM